MFKWSVDRYYYIDSNVQIERNIRIQRFDVTIYLRFQYHFCNKYVKMICFFLIPSIDYNFLLYINIHISKINLLFAFHYAQILWNNGYMNCMYRKTCLQSTYALNLYSRFCVLLLFSFLLLLLLLYSLFIIFSGFTLPIFLFNALRINFFFFASSLFPLYFLFFFCSVDIHLLRMYVYFQSFQCVFLLFYMCIMFLSWHCFS